MRIVLFSFIVVFGLSAQTAVESLLLFPFEARGPLYLIEQDFESTGYDHGETWSNVGGGTVDPDNTAVIGLANGSQSVKLTGPSATLEHTFTEGFTNYFFFAFSTSLVTSQHEILTTFTNSTQLATIYIKADGKIALYDQVEFFGATPADAIPANTTIFVWAKVAYEIDAAGTTELCWSTDQTKPTSGTKFATGTCTGAYKLNKVWLETVPSTTTNTWDKFRWIGSPIGSAPL